jgi:hypothetical protein
MSNETAGQYLVKLREMTTVNQLSVDMYKIGEKIGLVDKIQSDHIVEILSKDGYIMTDKSNSKVRLIDTGYQRLNDNPVTTKTPS